MRALPVLREQLHVSVSQLKTYLTCPRKYELTYVRGIEPAFTPVALAFGSAFHAAAGYYYRTVQRAKCPPPLEAVIQVFADEWRVVADGPFPLQDEDHDDPVDHLDRAAKMLHVFYSNATAAPPANVEAVELAFSIELHDPATGAALDERLVGAIDLVLADDKKRTVVELKTSAKRWSQDQIAYDLQPTAYRLAARQLGLGDVGLQLHVFTKTKSPFAQLEEFHRGLHDEDDLLRTVTSILRAIDANVFHRVRGWACKGCAVAYVCPQSR